MKYNTILLGCIILLSLYTNMYADQDKELKELAEKLFQSTPIPCKENNQCYCLEHKLKTSKLSLRYSRSQFCEKEIIPGKLGFEFTSWDQNGKIVDDGFYLDGKLHGPFLTWYPNGIKESKGQYENGKAVGLFTKWHDDGSLAVQGTFKNGEYDGEWLYWDKEGNIIEKQLWDNGVLKTNQIKN